MPDIDSLLKQIQGRLGLNSAEMAERIGVSPAYYSQVCKGIRALWKEREHWAQRMGMTEDETVLFFRMLSYSAAKPEVKRRIDDLERRVAITNAQVRALRDFLADGVNLTKAGKKRLAVVLESFSSPKPEF